MRLVYLASFLVFFVGCGTADQTTLSISGHTDTSGRRSRNEYLSKGRAESVRQVFVAAGVAAERLQAAGYADQRLLPNLAPKAAEHRRVELEFADLRDGPNATEMVKRLNALIAEYR